MTVEDALIALLAVVAGILLFVGLAQALDSRTSRRGRPRFRDTEGPLPYRPRAATPAPSRAWAPAAGRSLREEPEIAPQWAGGDEASPAQEAVAAPPVPPPIPSGAPARPEPIFPERTPEPISPEPVLQPVLFGSMPEPVPLEREPEPVPPEGRTEPVVLERAPSDTSAEEPAIAAEPAMLPVEICARLVLAGHDEDAVAAAELHLAQGEGEGSAVSAHVRAGLLSLAGLSRQALHDDGGADAAFAAALTALPEVVGEDCPPRLAAMAMPIARRLLEWAERSPEGAKERIVGGRLAAFWLRWRLVAAPGDGGAEALLDAARVAVAEGHASAATALIAHQQWHEAARVIGLARDAGELPEVRAELLMEIIAASLRREIERLTAPVIRGAKNESRALGALERSESTLASVRDLDLPARQRLAMTRRIWRGYAKLGMARLQAGSLDAAAEALLHALGMPEIGRARQRHVRDAVVKAIETAGDEKVDQITKLLAEGDRFAAAEQAERFVTLIKRARERGVPERALTVASTKGKVLANLIEPAP